MKKLLAALILALVASAASAAYVQGPTQLYAVGPSEGNLVRNAESYVGCINSQTGTSYTVTTVDRGCLLVFNNASAVAVTWPQAGTTGWGQMSQAIILNLGAGTITVTPTISTINGSATKIYAQNASGRIVSDGTNYYAY